MVSADMNKDTGEVTAMFDEVAAGYDRTRNRLWWGRMDAWGHKMAAQVKAGRGQVVLDVAAGTGTSSAALLPQGATVVACDISPGMLAIAAQRYPQLTRVVADAQQLPFEDGIFDAVTISFGLRNIADTVEALRQMRRVTADGGRLVVCEFSMPPGRVPRALWDNYLRRAVPLIGARLGSNPQAYRYLAQSIKAWHSPAALGALIEQAGWQQVAWQPLDFGVVHLHTAIAG